MGFDAQDRDARGVLARLEASARRVEVPHHGRRVAWRRFGEGAPLVLIHGGHGSWMHWVRNIEALAAEHAVWVPDMPGFGDSDDLPVDPHAPDRMRFMVDALLGTLDALIAREAPLTLAAFSFGALPATALAVRRGAVARMALLGPGGHGGTRRQRVPLVDWRSDDPAVMRERLRANLSPFMLHDAAHADDLAMHVHEASCLRTRFRSKALSQAGGLKASLDRFPGPVLLIWGEHDVTAVPEEIAPTLAGDRPERQWCVVPGAGHWVQYERARDVNGLLTAWFRPGAVPDRAMAPSLMRASG